MTALVAVARILVVVWHRLADATARSATSGPTTTPAASAPKRHVHKQIRQLAALGYTITLKPAE